MDILRRIRRGSRRSPSASSVDPNQHHVGSAIDPKVEPATDPAPAHIIGPDAPVSGVDHNVSGAASDDDADQEARTALGGTANGHVANGNLPEDGGKKVDDSAEKQGEGEEEEVEDTSNYPKGVQLALLTFGLAMAIFVVRPPVYKIRSHRHGC